MKSRNALLLCLLALFTQYAGLAQGNLRPPERPDDPYVPAEWQSRERTLPVRSASAGFFYTQVNVDSNGMNIVGDAANEPSIAVDPTNPLKIVIGWRQFDTISSNFRQAGNGYTTDGGLTWQYHDVIQRGIFRSDPVLESDSYGVIYYNSLTSDGGNFTCQVFKSYDGGATWDNGVFAQGGDKQWMAIDKTGGIGDGNVYAYWTSFYSACPPGHFTRSTDYGGSFQPCLTIPGDPYWGTLDVAIDGDLYIGAAAGTGFQVIKSTNAQDSSQALAWGPSVPVDLDGDISFGGPNEAGLLGQTSVAVDNSSGPTQGNVYVLCSVDRFSNSDPLDVMFARSTDGGVTWSDPVRVNDDPGTTNFQWFGTMSVAPNGRIDAIWLDTRDNPGTVLSSLYYSSSVDAGVTWSPNERLSEEFDPHVGWPQQNKMGDYFDMVSDEAGAHLAWAGTFTGGQDVYYGRILADAFIPAAPALASPPDQSTGQPLTVQLVWNGSVGASGYHVQVDTDESFASPLVDDSTLTGTMREITSLSTSTTYYWRVTARSAGGESEWSEVWNFVTSVNPPAAPALAFPPDGATGIPTSLTMVWTDTASNATHHLQVATEATFSDPVVDESGIMATMFQVEGLAGETTHYWRVSTSNAGGTSLWSAIWSFTTMVMPPGAPVLLAPPDGYVSPFANVLFRWNSIPGVSTYHFQLATDETFIAPIVDDSTLSVNLRNVTDLVSGEMYYWRVSAANDGGVGPWSDVWMLSVLITGVEEGEGEIPVNFVLDQNYPNPFNPSTNIRFGLPVKSQVLVDVFDILGRQVAVLADGEFGAGYHDVVLDARNLGGGVYFYRLTTPAYVETRKFVVMK